MDSQWTHKGLTKDSHRIHTKIIEKALVLLGCPRKWLFFTLVLPGCPRKALFLHWFYTVVRETCCFYISFTRVVREKPYETLVKNNIFRGQPTRHAFATEEEELNSPHNSPSYTIESLISRSLARTHERNETISRFGFTKDSHLQYTVLLCFTKFYYVE